MKKILISLVLIVSITSICYSNNKDNIPIIKSEKSSFEPNVDVWYKLYPNNIYITQEIGPAARDMSIAWSAANEFVYRTVLRNEYELPGASASQEINPTNNNDCLYFIIKFKHKTSEEELKILVEIKNKVITRIKIK